MSLQLSPVAAGVHRFASVYTNWYVLEEGGRLTVLDTGLPGDWEGFCTALARLGHTLEAVDAVLVTHHHPDHAGNAERLRSHGARVFSHPADAPYLRGDKRLSNRSVVRFLWRPWYARYMLGYLAKGITRVPAVAALDELADGTVLEVPGSPRVLHAPGHTPGSCALFLEGRSFLFSGDALVTLDLTRGPRGRPGPQIVRGPHTADADLAEESLDVLAATRAEVVLPGHGEPWLDGVGDAVDIARRSAPPSLR
jgi:glyoxylase-like metal-dependent hydrolase (beta-lactamase superfamily II)